MSAERIHKNAAGHVLAEKSAPVEYRQGPSLLDSERPFSLIFFFHPNAPSWDAVAFAPLVHDARWLSAR